MDDITRPCEAYIIMETEDAYNRLLERGTMELFGVISQFKEATAPSDIKFAYSDVTMKDRLPYFCATFFILILVFAATAGLTAILRNFAMTVHARYVEVDCDGLLETYTDLDVAERSAADDWFYYYK